MAGEVKIIKGIAAAAALAAALAPLPPVGAGHRTAPGHHKTVTVRH